MINVRSLAVSLLASATLTATALTPSRFKVSLDLRFERFGTALSAEQRELLDAHLQGMAAKGQCGIELVTVIGDGAKSRGYFPVTDRERYLREILERRGFPRAIHVPRMDPDSVGLGNESARISLEGRPEEIPCVVKERTRGRA